MCPSCRGCVTAYSTAAHKQNTQRRLCWKEKLCNNQPGGRGGKSCPIVSPTSPSSRTRQERFGSCRHPPAKAVNIAIDVVVARQIPVDPPLMMLFLVVLVALKGGAVPSNSASCPTFWSIMPGVLWLLLSRPPCQGRWHCHRRSSCAPDPHGISACDIVPGFPHGA